MKVEKSTKRHDKGGHSSALVPVPDKLAALLKLVNLLPGCIRHPYWAAANRNFEGLSGLKNWIRDIFEWRPNTKSTAGVLAEEIEEELPQWVCYNSPYQLWFLLTISIEKLPLLLQAFVLNDDDGKLLSKIFFRH